MNVVRYWKAFRLDLFQLLNVGYENIPTLEIEENKAVESESFHGHVWKDCQVISKGLFEGSWTQVKGQIWGVCVLFRTFCSSWLDFQLEIYLYWQRTVFLYKWLRNKTNRCSEHLIWSETSRAKECGCHNRSGVNASSFHPQLHYIKTTQNQSEPLGLKKLLIGTFLSLQSLNKCGNNPVNPYNRRKKWW